MPKSKILDFAHKIFPHHLAWRKSSFWMYAILTSLKNFFNRHISWKRRTLIIYTLFMIPNVLIVGVDAYIYHSYYCLRDNHIYSRDEILEELAKEVFHRNEYIRRNHTYDSFISDPRTIIEIYDYPYDPFLGRYGLIEQILNYLFYGNDPRRGGKMRSVVTYYKEKSDPGIFYNLFYIFNPCMNNFYHTGIELSIKEVNIETNNEYIKRGIYE